MMGGDVTVESELGQGLDVHHPAAAGERARSRVPSRASRRRSPAGGRAGTVLVIDDDPAARDLMKRFLTREGFQAVVADNGEEGLRLAREVHPNVITLDVMMPKMDGWAVLQQLKADPQLRDTPVIMVTIVDDKNLGYTLGRGGLHHQAGRSRASGASPRQIPLPAPALSGAADRGRRHHPRHDARDAGARGLAGDGGRERPRGAGTRRRVASRT